MLKMLSNVKQGKKKKLELCQTKKLLHKKEKSEQSKDNLQNRTIFWHSIYLINELIFKTKGAPTTQ